MTARIYVDGRLETQGNANTPNGGADVDWGDGNHQALPGNRANYSEGVTHVYDKAGIYFPSARITQDYKYDGNGSCSYRCDIRRAAVAVVHVPLKPPYLHQVVAGDSLFAIAQKYGVKNWVDVYEANSDVLESPNLLVVGQQLLVTDQSVNSAKSTWNSIKQAWSRIRGAGPLELEKPEIEPLKGVSEDGLGAFGEWLNDKQKDIQAEGQRHEVEKQVTDMLNAGSPGVVVKEGIYAKNDTEVPIVEIIGPGPTVLGGLSNGLNNGRFLPDTNGLIYEPDKSHLSFYSMKNGKLNRQDLPAGMYTSGDSEKIQDLADKEREALSRGEKIAHEMDAAKQKQQNEGEVKQGMDIAKASASQRQSIDQGPRSQPVPSGSPSGRAGPTAHPDVMDHGTGLPKNEGGTSGGGNGGGNGTGGVGGKGGTSKEPIDLSPGSVIIGDPHAGGKEDGGGGSIDVIRPLMALNSGLRQSPERPVQVPTKSAEVSSTTKSTRLSALASDSWGLPNTRTWVDLANDGSNEFCRTVVRKKGKPLLKCTFSQGRGIDELYTGKTFEAEISFPKVPGTWVDFNGDGTRDYCRALPIKGDRGYLSCIPSTSDGFGSEIRTGTLVYLGIASGRTWIDINGDGKADFCTMRPTGKGTGKLLCVLSRADSFSTDTIESAQIHWRGPGFRSWLVSAGGQPSFCTVAGPRDEFVDCVLAEDGKFRGPYRDLLRKGDRR